MEDKTSSNTPKPSDEMDLGQLFIMFKEGINKLVIQFLKLFIYLKKNGIKLAILVVFGAVAGFIFNYYGDKKLKTEVIVKPNFASENYLYNIVSEVNSNILVRDALFFEKIGIDIEKLKGFKVEIEPIGEEDGEKDAEGEMKYLQLLLENFKGENFAQEIIKSEILKKSAVNHRITFFYNNVFEQSKYVPIFLKFINNNEYYNEIGTVYRANTKSRIEKNAVLISQVDELISNYSKGLTKEKPNKGEGTIYLDNESGLNVPSLLALKNRLLKEVEEKKIELVEEKQIVQVINLGNPQIVKKSILKNKIIMFPLMLLILFFLVAFIGRLNRKTKEMQL